MSALKAGVLYFLAVFAAGFVFGTIRTLWIEPAVGELAAVLLEAPVMLALSYFVARRLLRRFRIATAGDSAIMGFGALILLLVAELLLARAFGQTTAEFIGDFATPAGATGLVAFLAFAAMPLVLQISISPRK